MRICRLGRSAAAQETALQWECGDNIQKKELWRTSSKKAGKKQCLGRRPQNLEGTIQWLPKDYQQHNCTHPQSPRAPFSLDLLTFKGNMREILETFQDLSTTKQGKQKRDHSNVPWLPYMTHSLRTSPKAKLVL